MIQNLQESLIDGNEDKNQIILDEIQKLQNGVTILKKEYNEKLAQHDYW